MRYVLEFVGPANLEENTNTQYDDDDDEDDDDDGDSDSVEEESEEDEILMWRMQMKGTVWKVRAGRGFFSADYLLFYFVTAVSADAAQSFFGRSGYSKFLAQYKRSEEEAQTDLGDQLRMTCM